MFCGECKPSNIHDISMGELLDLPVCISWNKGNDDMTSEACISISAAAVVIYTCT